MSFGSFQSICETAPIPLCSLVGPYNSQKAIITSTGAGIEALCYSRSIEWANTMIFQAANDFVHILALVMCSIMVLHVRSKFTAVGKFSTLHPYFSSSSRAPSANSLNQAGRKSHHFSTCLCSSLSSHYAWTRVSSPSDPLLTPISLLSRLGCRPPCSLASSSTVSSGSRSMKMVPLFRYGFCDCARS